VVLSPLIVTALAGAAILLLPGILIFAVAGFPDDFDIAERLAFGAIVSWCVLAALCVIAFTIESNLGRAEAMLLGLNVVLAAVWIYRRPSIRLSWPGAWQVTMLIGIAVVALLVYRVGGYTNPEIGPGVASGWSTMEESLQISTVRKIEGAPRLRVDEVMYAKGELATYYYPVYPFVLALMSRTSGLDPMVLFDTFRLWTAALGLLALYALAAGAFGRTAGAVATLTAIALVLAGYAGQAAGLGSWGQLMPLSHIADFGLGVLLPLALAVVVRVAGADSLAIPLTVLALAFLMAMALTHTREAAHVASYLGAALIVGPIIGATSRVQWVRLAALAWAMLLFVSAYSAAVQRNVPFIAEHEHASAARARVDTVSALRAGAAESVHLADVPPVLRPYVTLAFLVAPIMLVRFRRSAAVVMLAAGLLVWWIPLHVSLVGRLLERIVYSEIMQSPSRYVFHVSYLMYGIVLYAALLALDALLAWLAPLNRAHKIAAAIVVAALVPFAIVRLPAFVDLWLGPRPLLTATLAAALAVAAARLWPRPVAATASGFRNPAWVMTAAAITFVLTVQASTQPTLFAQARSRGWPPRSDIEAWYQRTAVHQVMPWNSVHMLRTAIPQRSVIAADPSLGLAIPLVSDQYILVSGTNFTTDLHYLEAVQRVSGRGFDAENDVDWSAYRKKLRNELTSRERDDVLAWERYYHRLAQLVAIGSPAEPRQAPIFNNGEPPEVTLRLLDTLHPDYLLVSPLQNRRLSDLVAARVDRFERVAAADRFVLYRVRYPNVTR
jgi:hypothetical protein